MKPFFILISSFLITLLGTLIVSKEIDPIFSGRLALAVMLIFASIGHFKYKKTMAMMLPHFVPKRQLIILLTGLIEIAAAVGIFIPQIQRITGILLILFFILILPANIYASLHNINFETGNRDGKGMSYLYFFRIPFQILLVIWTFIFVVR